MKIPSFILWKNTHWISFFFMLKKGRGKFIPNSSILNSYLYSQKSHFHELNGWKTGPMSPTVACRNATCSSLVMRLAVFEKSLEFGMASRFGADFVPILEMLKFTRLTTLRSSQGSRTADMPGRIFIIRFAFCCYPWDWPKKNWQVQVSWSGPTDLSSSCLTTHNLAIATVQHDFWDDWIYSGCLQFLNHK